MVKRRLVAATVAVLAAGTWALFGYTSAMLLGTFDVPGPPSLPFFAIALLVHVPLLAVSVVPGASVALNIDAVPRVRRSSAKVLALAGVLLFPLGGMWLLVGAAVYAVGWRSVGDGGASATPEDGRSQTSTVRPQ